VGPRSRPLYNRGEFSALGGNWVDEAAGQGTGENPVDGFRDLAKVGGPGTGFSDGGAGRGQRGPPGFSRRAVAALAHSLFWMERTRYEANV
jgi:hypothetical protein